MKEMFTAMKAKVCGEGCKIVQIGYDMGSALGYYYRNESSGKVKIILDFKVLKKDWDKKARLIATGVNEADIVKADDTDSTKVAIKGELKPGQEFGWILAHDHKGTVEGRISLALFK